jgi:hypothetical protein
MYTRNPANPKSVIFLKPERTKSVVLDGDLLTLKQCAKCNVEFWAEEVQVKCEPCRSAVRRKTTTAKRKKTA